MGLWETIFAAVVGNALVLGVLGWLAIEVTRSIQKRDTARFESDLKNQAENAAIELKARNEVAMAELKASLEIFSTEHRIRFTKLHERRAEVLGECYKLLVESLHASQYLSNPISHSGEPTPQEKYRLAMNAWVAFNVYLDTNRIYFPAKVAKSLAEFARDVRGAMVGYGVYLRFDPDQMNGETNRKMLEAWVNADDKLTKDVPPIRELLEDELRALLGDKAGM